MEEPIVESKEIKYKEYKDLIERLKTNPSTLATKIKCKKLSKMKELKNRLQ